MLAITLSLLTQVLLQNAEFAPDHLQPKSATHFYRRIEGELFGAGDYLITGKASGSPEAEIQAHVKSAARRKGR
jgi:hypothetical protein